MNKLIVILRILFLLALVMMLMGTLSLLFAARPAGGNAFAAILAAVGNAMYPIGFTLLGICLLGWLWIWVRGRFKA